jgi:maleate cis-trans isomerase
VDVHLRIGLIIPSVNRLERAPRRSVVSSNQAVLWYALRACGSDVQVQGLGALLRAPVAV